MALAISTSGGRPLLLAGLCFVVVCFAAAIATRRRTIRAVISSCLRRMPPAPSYRKPDKAYAWAERRRIEAHPATGAIQIVELRERVEEVTPAVRVPPSGASTNVIERPIFAQLSGPALLSTGVPTDWLEDVRAATEERFFDLAPHLPAEASEALLQYATTGALPAPAPIGGDPYAHPDAQRRIRLIVDEEELRQALDYPWEKWGVFLHPSQRAVVERRFNGPARVSGSAGTGKTVVALRRAVALARKNPHAKLLLTTFS
jgi:hypothetical protein